MDRKYKNNGHVIIHNSENIIMENILLKNNSIYDDTLHSLFKKYKN